VTAPRSNSLFIAVANFSQTAVWVFSILLLVEFVALCVYVNRSADADEEEGHVVTDDAPLSRTDRVIAGEVLVRRKLRSKKKVFVGRSAYVSDMALVDGSATKSQRLFVHGIQLAFLLFWLTFVFGALTLLDSDPAFALSVVFLMSCGLFYGVTAIRRGRANALRKWNKSGRREGRGR
jgi:hypothetical protein